MKGGRKNLKRASMEKHITLQDGQSVMHVVSLRGSNLIEVLDAHGSFVVVDDSGKEKALESGRKVACIVSQVLCYEQVCALQNSPEWLEIFKSSTKNESNESLHGENLKGSLHGNASPQGEDKMDSIEDDGLPPLEANTNRMKPFELRSDSESDSGSDADC